MRTKSFIKTKTLILILSLTIGISSLAGASRIRPKPFRGELQLSRSPKVGGNATLTLSFDSMCDESFKATIVFWIPDGITAQTYQSGTDATQVRFEQAYVHARSIGNSYPVAISVDKVGNYTLRASIYAKLRNGRLIRQHFYTHLLVTPTSSQKSQTPFDSDTLDFGLKKNLLMRSQQSRQATGQVEVFGSITYFDLNESRLLPINGLKMILVKDNFLMDKELAVSYTDVNGKFAFPPISKEPDERLDLYVVASFSNDILYITNRSNRIYESESQIVRDVQDGELEFELELDQNPELGSISNNVTKGHDFFVEKAGWRRDTLQVVWPAKGNVSYYFVESYGKKISREKLNIIEEDAWENISIYHEYGHSVMTAAYGNNIDALPQSNYNGSHMLDTVSDPDFAMNEGWAEFVEAAVEDNALNVTGYINADKPNIETNAWWTGDVAGKGSNKAGENVEGTVASILWDITDTKDSIDLSPNVDDDGISDMFAELWTIFVEDRPTNITNIAVGWRNRNFPKLSELEAIYAQHHTLSKRNSPPILIITEPSDDLVVNQSFTIRWNVKEPDGDDYKVNLFYLYQNIKYSIVSSLTSDRDEYAWNTKSLKDGKYYIVVQVIDSHGDVAQKTSNSAVFIDHSPLMPPKIASSTHPDQSQWYADNSPQFELSASVASSLGGDTDPRGKYSYVLNQNAETVPDERYDLIGNILEISGLPDGEWYLHVRALDDLGYWTEPSHFSVKIDQNPPSTVKNVRWESQKEPAITNHQSPITNLLWDAVTDLSGIEGYQVQIDVDSRDFVDGLFYDDFVKGTSETFELPAGSTYYARVKAKNGAGLLSRNWSISSAIEIKASNPYDVNNDGRVDIFDLVLVGKNFGRQIEEPIAENPDVNGDGKVDLFDLVLVGSHFGEMQESRKLENRKAMSLRAKRSNLKPESQKTGKWENEKASHSSRNTYHATRLYQNYPNPFNPETWIPYSLSDDAEVSIKIYGLSGNLVKTLFCGYQKAGDYTSRSKAAFWNGKNERGMEVASGVYFYVLQAGDGSPLIRKMLVVK